MNVMRRRPRYLESSAVTEEEAALGEGCVFWGAILVVLVVLYAICATICEPYGGLVFVLLISCYVWWVVWVARRAK